MKRAQIYLDDGAYETLRTEAFKRRASISAILRELIQINIIGQRKKRSPAGLDAIIGLVHDAKKDVSVRHDEYLWGEKD